MSYSCSLPLATVIHQLALLIAIFYLVIQVIIIRGDIMRKIILTLVLASASISAFAGYHPVARTAAVASADHPVAVAAATSDNGNHPVARTAAVASADHPVAVAAATSDNGRHPVARTTVVASADHPIAAATVTSH